MTDEARPETNGHGGGTGRPAQPEGRCAFLVASMPHDLQVDDDLVRGPLGALGWTLEDVPWDRAEDWDRFDLVVVRSAWDYHRDVAGFEAALARIHASGTALANPLPLLRWNLRKTYLLELQDQGVPIVPTRVVDDLSPGRLAELRAELGTEDLVVKPVVGANGDDVYRVDGDRGDARAVASAFRGRPALVQPFLAPVLTEGEVSLIFLDGELSHGLRKRPSAGEFRTQEERGAALSPFQPDPGLRSLAGKALHAAGDAALDTDDAAADGPQRTLYARVDLIRDPEGDWRLVELELVEPSLYLRLAPDAPRRFARALTRWPQQR